MPSNSKPPSSKTSTVSTSWSSMAAAPVIKASPTATVKASKSASSLAPVTSIKPQPKPGTPAPPPSKSNPVSSHTDNSKTNTTSHVHVLKPIHFDVTCTGMKPLTVHKFYYEGIDVSQFCTLVTSVGSVLPATTGLITDKNGNIEFKFNFKADLLSTVVGLDKTKHILAGDKKFELLATGSSAAKIVPYKN